MVANHLQEKRWHFNSRQPVINSIEIFKMNSVTTISGVLRPLRIPFLDCTYFVSCDNNITNDVAYKRVRSLRRIRAGSTIQDYLDQTTQTAELTVTLLNVPKISL